MPYKIKGKCIYKKDSGAKVGCTDGDVDKYLSALNINVNDAENKKLEEIRIFIKETINEKFSKNKSDKKDSYIHLPELIMKKDDLIKYLKELYNLRVLDDAE